MNKIVVSGDFFYARKFVESLPATFEDGGKLLYDGRNTVKAFDVDGTTLVVKKFKTPNIFQRVAYSFFKKSKAERAYLYARMLRERGVSTPREVAYIELRRGILLSDSYFVSTECALPALFELIRRPDFDHDAADALARFIVTLHEKGVLHGDLNLTNILYERSADGQYSFTLIDTNRSKFRTPTHRDCINNMIRLTHVREVLGYVTARYAGLRGWNVEQTVSEVTETLDNFEHRKKVKGQIKRKIRK